MKKEYIIPSTTVCRLAAYTVMTSTSMSFADDKKDYDSSNVGKYTDESGSLWGD